MLVLSNPFAKDSGYLNEKSQYERAGLKGLSRGLGSKSPVEVGFPDIRPEYATDPLSLPIPPDTRTPLSFLMQPESLDRLAEAHSECQVIVSLIGLPAGVGQLKVWGQSDPRSFGLLLPDLRVLGSPAEVVASFQRQKLLAVVTEDTQSGQPLIVTRENVEDVLQRQPKALGF